LTLYSSILVAKPLCNAGSHHLLGKWCIVAFFSQCKVKTIRKLSLIWVIAAVEKAHSGD
jgi:hypothetical protein